MTIKSKVSMNRHQTYCSRNGGFTREAMARRMLFFPAAAASLSSTSAFVVPTSSGSLTQPAAARLTLTSAFNQDLPHLAGRRPGLRRARTSNVCMMAKKKKGPAADALSALEALELTEEDDVAVEEPSSPPPAAKQKAKKKKKGAKGPAADALAALEGLETEGTLPLGNDAPQIAPAETTMPTEEPKQDMASAEGVDQEHAEPHMLLIDPAIEPKKGKKTKKKSQRQQEKQERGEQTVQPDQIMDALEDDAHVEDATDELPDLIVAPIEGGKEEETLESQIRKTRPPPSVRISSSSQPGFVSLRLDGVAVTFRNQEVVKDATWEVKSGDRLGLVGPNGGGKTTQVRILAGELEPTAGEVIKSAKNLRVSFLRQEFIDGLVMERSLKDELTSVFTEEAKILSDLQACEDKLQQEAVQQDPEEMENVLNLLSTLQDQAESKRVYDLDTKVQRMMDLMGFSISEGEQPVSSFSGGWRMRIGLGKILLTDPNILLLDEPTNHLDMESVEWLEAFLQNQNLPMVIVSHDREFLDQVCTGIVDTDGGVATTYSGNYSRFLKLKSARMESWQAAYRNQQKKIKDERSWINKFKTKGAWAAQVKSREKALEKLLASDDYVKQPPRMGKPFRFRFPPAPRAGSSEDVLSAEDLGHGYNGRTLFEHVDITVGKGQRIAFLGPNGAGKSTLLRLLVGEEQPMQGSCSIGSKIVKQYFEQNQADVLDLSKTVVETMMEASSIEKYEDLRKLLGQFMFKGDAVEKSVGQLSGGEKARVALCKMMLTPANLLVLDEPTNHLDIPAKEMLEEALQHYEGAVLLVSHDRFFVSQVATTVCNLEDGTLVRYDGDYRYFLERHDNILEKVESRYVAGVEGIKKAKKVDLDELSKQKKSFGGKGGPSGRKDKGVKNAKRFSDAGKV